MSRIAAIVGVLVIVAPAGIVAQAPAELVAMPGTRIGSVDWDAERSLTSIAEVAIDQEGRLYITQPLEGLVKVFRPTGEFERQIGRSGRGPGEFVRPTRVGVLGDSVYVLDEALRRATFFTRAGDLLGTVLLSPPALGKSYGPAPAYAILPDGSAVLAPIPLELLEGGSRTVETPYLRITEDGQIADTLFLTTMGPFRIVIRRGAGKYHTAQPFANNPLVGVAPGGGFLVVVDQPEATNGRTGRFRVTKVSQAGDTVLTRAYTYRPRRIPKQMVDSIVSRYTGSLQRSRMLGRPSRRTAEKLFRDAFYLPAYMRPVAGVVVSDEGMIWLRAEAYAGSTSLWYALDRKGEVVHQVHLPRGASVRAVRGQSMWAVEQDSLDVPFVQEYRLSSAPRQSVEKGST